jgi:hypothetical protein
MRSLLVLKHFPSSQTLGQNNLDSIAKNMFGFSILLFTASNVIDKSYRQVLTLVNSAQLLLKLEILDKFRLVTNHKTQHKEKKTLP